MHLRASELTWQKVGDELVVLDLGSSRYLQVNGTGRTLWEALATGASEEELVDLVITRFGRDRELAEGDVRAFVADLEARGLLEE